MHVHVNVYYIVRVLYCVSYVHVYYTLLDMYAYMCVDPVLNVSL